VFSNTLKRAVAAGVAAVVLSGAAVGLANAQGASMTPAPDQYQDGGGRHHEGGGGFERGVALGVAAQAIGITPQQLRTELPGKSLAQVAQAHGKNPADVATALKNAANQRIDAEVAAGELTADQAAQRKQTVDQHIDQGMNEVVPVRQPSTTPGASPVPASSPIPTT
jgi:hypothetical protein